MAFLYSSAFFFCGFLAIQVIHVMGQQQRIGDTTTSDLEGNIYALCKGIPPYANLMANGFILLNKKSETDQFEGVDARITTIQNETKELYKNVKQYLENQRTDTQQHDGIEQAMKHAKDHLLYGLEKIDENIQKTENGDEFQTQAGDQQGQSMNQRDEYENNERRRGGRQQQSGENQLRQRGNGGNNDGGNQQQKWKIVNQHLEPALVEFKQACEMMTNYIQSNVFQPEDPLY